MEKPDDKKLESVLNRLNEQVEKCKEKDQKSKTLVDQQKEELSKRRSYSERLKNFIRGVPQRASCTTFVYNFEEVIVYHQYSI